MNLAKFMSTCIPVSYTHLDVYKRQQFSITYVFHVIDNSESILPFIYIVTAERLHFHGIVA